MLAIRMQRTGRSGHASFRVVVQDSRQTPTSGKFVALLGHYDPHAKTATITKDKVAFYLEHGAHPSERVARLLKQEGIKLPEWVEATRKKKAAIKNPDKLRRNRPAEEAKPAEAAAPVEEAPAEAEAPASEEVVAAEETAAPTEPEADAPSVEAEAPKATDEAESAK